MMLCRKSLVSLSLLFLCNLQFSSGYDLQDNPDIYLSATGPLWASAITQHPTLRAGITQFGATEPEIIRRHGYPSETHTIQTDDGYLLSLHRIPHGRNKSNNTNRPPVFLQHGLLSSSVDWIITGPDHSLAFMLADKGYDVWLGNIRGNDYSRSHVTYRTNDPKFWQFSWDEMSEQDLPAMISHILEVTGREKVSYVGHSMGTTMYFAQMAQSSTYHSKIDIMIALAPAVYVSHIRSPIRKLIPWMNDLVTIEKLLGSHGELMPQEKFMHYLTEEVCAFSDVSLDICSNLVFLISGYDKPQLNESLIPVILRHTPSGTSIRTPIHFAQLIKSGTFSKFDYGADNINIYNSTTPPSYNLTNVLTPVVLITADNDLMVSKPDLKILMSQLPQIVDHYVVPYANFTHIDFLFAIDAPTLVYDHVIGHLQRVAPISTATEENDVNLSMFHTTQLI